MPLKKIKKQIYTAYFIGIVFLILMIIIGFINYNEKIQQQNSIKISKEHINSIISINNHLNDLTNAKNNYFNLNREIYLQDFKSIAKKINNDLRQLTDLNESNQALQKDKQQLIIAITNKLANENNFIESLKFGKDSAKKLAENISYLTSGKRTEQNIRLYSTSIQASIKDLFTPKNTFIDIGFWGLLSIALTILIGFNVLFYFIISNYKKQEKNQQFLIYNSFVLRNISDAIVTTDIDYHITHWNKSAEKLFGFKEEEVIGKRLKEVLRTFSETKSVEELGSIIKNDKTWIGDLIYLNKANEKIFANVSTSLIYGENDEETGTVSVIRDLTEKNKFQKTLINLTENLEEEINKKTKEIKISNDRFELISKITNEVIWDWNLETNEIWGNEKYKQLVDNDGDLKRNHDRFTSRMHPEDLENGSKVLKATIEKKESIMITEYRFLDKENNWLNFLNRQIILYNKNNAPYRIVGNIQDITYQKKIQQQILHEKELSDVLINSLPGVFYMFSKEGKLLRWNNNIMDISGYTSDELAAMPAIQLVPLEQRELLATKIDNVFNYGIDNAEAELLTKDGQKIPYYFTGIYVRYNNEDCLIGVGVDISEKIKTQTELRELAKHLQHIREEERTRIAREIHDELGQQLTGLKMDLSWLQKRSNHLNTEFDEKLMSSLALVDETVKTVRRISSQLRPSILDDLGLISALEWQSDEMQKRYHIHSLFFSNVSSINLKSEIATAIFRIYQESLTNVLRHAQATEVNTTIELNRNHLILVIADNGIGFDEKFIKDKKTLGLLGMKERTLMLGGTFKIESKEKEGTTLIVNIPFDNLKVIS
jgi:PAS domain S-box-containing protein